MLTKIICIFILFLDGFPRPTAILDINVGESCRDWTSSSIRPVLYIPYYYTPWHPLSIMSFISGISDDTVSFDEIAVLFKYLSPKVGYLCRRHNNQVVISYQYGTLRFTYRQKCVSIKSIGDQRKWR